MKVKTIGVIHTPFKDKKTAPIQPAKSSAKGKVELFKSYVAGLESLDKFSHVILLYQFHKSRGFKLKVKPFLDDNLRGLFATRYPCRPNQIGLSVVSILQIRKNIIEVGNIDVLDGTPLLDIKPYVPQFGDNASIGWLKGKIK
ncbi:MAG TPA: tRNA (N6-threonylcarbamoyladenosine(37)-N6)-methyltransferase TrmO [Elusimicrobiales bacterium]|nr:tRNA (N6-threonylcarbamoyladenosine(37)-N6)-methyltransferase TrmO [Elusimicrobiales bacterium]